MLLHAKVRTKPFNSRVTALGKDASDHTANKRNNTPNRKNKVSTVIPHEQRTVPLWAREKTLPKH